MDYLSPIPLFIFFTLLALVSVIGVGLSAVNENLKRIGDLLKKIAIPDVEPYHGNKSTLPDDWKERIWKMDED